MPEAGTPWWSTPLSPEILMIGLGGIWAVLAFGLSGTHPQRLINVTAAGLAAWGFNPKPLEVFVAVEAFVPWLALGIMAAARDRDPQRPDVTFLILGPSLALLLAWMSKTRFQLDLIDPTPPWIAAFACAVIMTGLSLLLGPKDSPHRQTLFIIGLLSGGYGFTTASYANVLLDDGPAQTYAVKVTAKTKESRKKTYYNVDFAPWPLKPEGSRHQLDEDTFAALQPGDTVCVTVRPGRFGWRWQSVAPCPGQIASKGKHHE